jgi:hypothetical protein
MNGLMHPLSEFCRDVMKLGGKSLLHGDPTNCELSVAVHPTIMIEPKKAKGFGLALPVKTPAVPVCKTIEPD